MDNQKKIYDVKFVGQDYQPISDAAKRMVITCEGREYFISEQGEICLKGSNEENDRVYSRILLDKMLEEVAPHGKCNPEFVVNEGKIKLYDSNFGSVEERGYFCGIVGVIRKQISMFLKFKEKEEKYIFNMTLQIKSRLDVDEQGIPGKPFFLSTMLLRDKVKLSDNMIPNNEEEIFDYLLLFWFKEHLQKACLKGYYKTYRRFERNDDRLRGTIDISQHIKLNMGQKNGSIAYSYRENTIDNFLNYLIVAAYNHLKYKYYELVSENFDDNIELKKTIDYLSNEIKFSNMNKAYLMNKNIKKIAHPYFTEYEQLRVTCLKILRDEGVSFFDGNIEQDTQGILFYLPNLWELFLEDEVFSKCASEKILFESQVPVDNFGYKNKDMPEGYVYKQNTRPDYVFFAGEEPFMILDAKCKPKWESVFEQSSVKEVMEDYNKCIRDMVAIDANATGVVFPTNNESEIDEMVYKHSISKYNKNAFFYTLPISVPKVKQEDSFTSWYQQFKDNLNKRIEIIRKILEDERKYAEHIQEFKVKMRRC